MKACRVCGIVQTDFPVVKGYTLRMCRTCYNAQRRASHAPHRAERNAEAVRRYRENINGTKDKHHDRSVAKYATQGAQVRQWFDSLPIDKQREIGRRRQARYRAELADCYVRRLITASTMDVPESLIQAKKLQIQIERFCNEKL